MNMSALTKAGDTALNIATRRKDYQMMEFLHMYGVKVNSADAEGRTALHVATSNNYRRHLPSDRVGVRYQSEEPQEADPAPLRGHGRAHGGCYASPRAGRGAELQGRQELHRR